jgi:hypothetical protein
MPLLTHLSIRQQLTGQHAQVLAGVHLATSHSLDVDMNLCHAWLLQGCTQLKALTLYVSNVQGASAVAQLAGLTQLELRHATDRFVVFSGEEQSELGNALAALSNLQSLSISHAPPGPITQALSQLTGLAELALTRQDLVPNPGPLTLPSCVKLTLLYTISVQQPASIDA